jgi:hypothetical protein
MCESQTASNYTSDTDLPKFEAAELRRVLELLESLRHQSNLAAQVEGQIRVINATQEDTQTDLITAGSSAGGV